MIKKIGLNVLKAELYILSLIIFNQVLRILMKGNKDLDLSFNQILIGLSVIGVLAIIEVFVRESSKKKKETK